jgi:nucleotide-binding universal stress UspA family protein
MKILLAVDGSECSDVAVGAVLHQMIHEQTEVRVLHVDEWPRDLPPALAFAEGPTAAREILAVHEHRRQDAEALVTRVAGRLQAAGFRTSTVVATGDARDRIVDTAAEWHADLIVVGSHGRRGFDRFLLGSVSESVVRHAPCSVEVVRAG